jgi:flagellar protein FlaG
MNDISLARPNLVVVPGNSRLTTKAADTVDLQTATGNILPPAPVNSVPVSSVTGAVVNEVTQQNSVALDSLNQVAENKSKKADSRALEKAVATANEFVQTIQRDLHFSIDDETERTVVKVVESSSGDVIRQIPDETFLELARKMKELGHMNLVDATG